MEWVPMNDLSRALSEERSSLIEVFRGVLSTGWLVQGPQHAGFESDLAEYLGVPSVVGVASGTDALELALRATMPAKRSTVITTANCGGYSTTAARRAGFKVRYADISRESLCIDADHLASIVDETVGVVVATHLYGRAADVAAVRAVCDPLGIVVLEDCAQALGARTAEGAVGSLGDVAAFSFYPTKNLGALGDGGAVAARSETVADEVRTLRQYGWRGKYTIEHDGGRNSRLDEVQAAFLRQRLHRLDEGNARRRQIISTYAQASSDQVHVLPANGPGHVGHLAVVIAENRDELRDHLASCLIKTDTHYPVPDYKQPALAAEYPSLELPVTQWATERILSVPVFPELRDDEIERVAHALASF
jgi:dTDP-3-amino-2,3,6-trideoxy-4-keto-D-glucose/dTDP-3-amino-3,4,6-trideoxy-alpha-D-glucose/dTDP-2,6-dideoxy-D-kanosamine transaminase